MKMNIKEEILKLKHGEKFIIPGSDYGKAEVWFINNNYILFKIPYLDGEPYFQDAYYKTLIDALIDDVSI